ncbi:U11/U12 small nuclear ribonucleoprotein 35 kDa protein-like isoform X2 [Myxocyprinus asiaticus]|nr:U11/U12 small nuclear ribonucleoprotein 35 kDa protein-like isoform X2 [Myxocyprinus asiaticus]XP_051541813.1 U11/U12 small nuclear ribonucleoprotein 35 kDa protein-like isoform X2 [Myxocyprinus asiaticus]
MMSEWCPVAKVYDPLRAGSIDGTDVEPHDKAVWRAMLARYKPNKGVTGDPHLTLFVARLNPQTSEEKLQEVFSKFGDIRRVRLVRDIITGYSKCYAFIEYKEERSVNRAWRDANKLVVDQYELFVDFEQERTLQGWIPRRLGGGQGGKKESGQLRFGGRDRPFRKPINLTSMMAPSRSADRWEGTSMREERQRDHEQDREHGRWRERKNDWERGNDWNERGHYKEKRDSKRHRERSRERDSNRDDKRRRDLHTDRE